MAGEFEQVYAKLAAWCRERDYSGHDPFDALNSRLFQATPLARSRLARLAWTQALKRSPVNLRALALVPPGKNPKGLALFALALLSRYRTRGGEEDLLEARALLDELVAARVETPGGGAAWGYNFDWQGRAFYAPRGTPAVVPTAFAVRALAEAAGTLAGAERATYSEAARRACAFVLNDLNRSVESDEEVCFSYTPLDRTRVYNASLLAAESLAEVGALTHERGLSEAAARAARYVVRRQRPEGFWTYGAEGFQSWADNFHTAFVLTSLARVRRRLAADVDDKFAELIEEADAALRRGFEFWRESFFLPDGWPKYYPDKKYPADAHSAAAAVVACAELRREFGDAATELARRVAAWAVRELFDGRGFFRYQKRRFHTEGTPFMRWSQGWMAYALARLAEVEAGDDGSVGALTARASDG
ncbi:MAG TPA: hypothetical protein VER32_13295 [Pyrinomonadaceae bacterium]|nr:hypothetical protein [Pyrinomonadaceae bacterium]